MYDLSTNTANSLTAHAARVGAFARAPGAASVRRVTSPATHAVAVGVRAPARVGAHSAVAVEADQP